MMMSSSLGDEPPAEWRCDDEDGCIAVRADGKEVHFPNGHIVSSSEWDVSANSSSWVPN